MARLKERPPLRPAAVGGPERTLVTTSTVKFLRGVANPLTCMNICNNTSYVGLLPKPSSFPLTGQIDCEKATLSLSFFLSLSLTLSLSLSLSRSVAPSLAQRLTLLFSSSVIAKVSSAPTTRRRHSVRSACVPHGVE